MDDIIRNFKGPMLKINILENRISFHSKQVSGTNENSRQEGSIMGVETGKGNTDKMLHTLDTTYSINTERTNQLITDNCMGLGGQLFSNGNNKRIRTLNFIRHRHLDGWVSNLNNTTGWVTK